MTGNVGKLDQTNEVPTLPTQPVKTAPVGALKIKDAAKYLGGVSQITVRRLIDRGQIKPNRALRHLLIPIRELDRFLTDGQ